MLEYQIAVIGGGPAGMAAALEAAKNGAEKIIILERADSLGGILEQCIHTGFGLHYFGEELSGPEYADRFIKEVEKCGAIDVKTDTMVLSISEDKIVTATSAKDGLMHIKAQAIILAMGCRERPRGALQMAGTRPAGVMTAGTAQKFVNIDGYLPGREIVILGSGDIGLIMARRMTLEGAVVKTVCEIMPFSGGLTRNIEQCLNDFNIPLRLSTTVIKTHGAERLEGVTIAKVDARLQPIPGTEEYIPCDTLLLSVGLIPENELSTQAGVTLDRATKGAVVSQTRQTDVEGIFACGNVLQVHDLVDYVTLEAQTAGKGAADYVKGARASKEFIKCVPGSGVSYVVPQKITLETEEDAKLYFRVRNIYKKKKVTVKADGEVISSKTHLKLAPGEMENVVVKLDDIKKLRGGSVIEVLVED